MDLATVKRLESIAPPEPSAAPLERHVICLGCRYDLFGQPGDGRCPECGGEVAESAVHGQLLALPGNVERLRSGTAFLLTASVLSAGCPGVCLIYLSSDGSILAAVLMTVVFAATAGFDIASVRRFGELDGVGHGPYETPPLPSKVRTADFAAAAGLILINLSAYAYVHRPRDEVPVMFLVSLGFALLMASAWRLAVVWGWHARLAHRVGRRSLATAMRRVGLLKAVYETAWLFCCATPFLLAAIGLEDPGIYLAVGAFLGLFGYAAIWIGMVGIHIAFYRAVRRSSDAGGIG